MASVTLVYQTAYLWLIFGALLATPVAENVQGRQQLSARAAILENISSLRIILVSHVTYTATLYLRLNVPNAILLAKLVMGKRQPIV